MHLSPAVPPADRVPDSDARRLRLCHDLRQNLGAIHHLVAALSETPGLTPDAEGRLADIRDEVDAASQLLRAEMAPERPVDTDVDLAEVIRGAARSHERLHDARVRVHVEAGPPVRLAGRPEDLRRAVANLVDNACRACPDGEVQVRVARRQCWLVVDVLDRGPGLGRVSHLTGHGLPQARAAAAAHGGRLRLSDRPGGGTRARLLLPVLARFAS
jgi:signal transduction histidine kinase